MPLRRVVDPPAVLQDVPPDVVDGATTRGSALLDMTPGRIDASSTHPTGR